MTLGAHLLLSWTLLSIPAGGVEPGSCGSVADPAQGQSAREAPASPPRVQGAPFEVPGLQIRLRPRAGELPAGTSVTVCYDWRWFSYPHPEKLFGAWSVSYQCRPCRLDSKGEVYVPPHTVVARGWYDGWLRFGRSPRFQGLRFEVAQADTQTFARLTRRRLERLREGKESVLQAESADWSLEATVDGR